MRTSTRIIYWFPRVLCILAILFISLFALDSFSPERTIWEQLGEFLIHLIPSFVLLAFLLVAWKWELVGGIIFMLIGLGFSPLIFMHNYRMNHSVAMSLWIITMITIPFVVVGVLFLISHRLNKHNLPAT